MEKRANIEFHDSFEEKTKKICFGISNFSCKINFAGITSMQLMRGKYLATNCELYKERS